MPDDVGHRDDGAWSLFVNAGTANELCSAWLAVICGKIGTTTAGLLVFRQGDGRFVPAALWPKAGADPSYLATTVEQTLKERRTVVVRPEATAPGQAPSLPVRAQVGFPLLHRDDLEGAVALDLLQPPEADTAAVLQELLWASAWLEGLLRDRDENANRSRLARTQAALETVAAGSEHRKLHAAAMAVANELALRLGCDRVSIGLNRNDRVRLVAMSHSAWFQPKSRLVCAIETAMQEALDQHATVASPPVASTHRRVAAAHVDLATVASDVAVASVIMTGRGRRIGALTLERSKGELFGEETIELSETIASVIGPILEMKSEAHRWVAGRIVDGTVDGLKALLGPRRPSLKLAALAALGVIGFLAFANGPYRVSAKAVVEGEEQRAAVVPFDGFIAEASSRAGDTVSAGQVLARLDDRDLRLEEAKAQAERAQLQQKYRDAAAKHDRVSAHILSAQIAETDARLHLVEERLARTRITVPFDGIVVTGDLSQKLGSPVQQGQVLFEITPLTAYRIILQVDERYVSDIAEKQNGRLVLTGLVSEALPFKVSKITPVSTAEEGKNCFRVEAALNNADPRIRPGMEGVGKILVDERNLFLIWTEPLWDWLRMAAWKWTP
jgi:RND family efflux transporter MFP subunit